MLRPRGARAELPATLTTMVDALPAVAVNRSHGILSRRLMPSR
jgi:hypothetical protein